MIVAWIVGRTSPVIGAEISIATQLILYVALTVYTVHRAEIDVGRGDAIAASANGLIALPMFLLAGLRASVLWFALTGRLDED